MDDIFNMDFVFEGVGGSSKPKSSTDALSEARELAKKIGVKAPESAPEVTREAKNTISSVKPTPRVQGVVKRNDKRAPKEASPDVPFKSMSVTNDPNIHLLARNFGMSDLNTREANRLDQIVNYVVTKKGVKSQGDLLKVVNKIAGDSRSLGMSPVDRVFQIALMESL